MYGRKITQCEKRGVCLSNLDCCYECDHRTWCDARCWDKECRREKIAERLGIKKGA